MIYILASIGGIYVSLKTYDKVIRIIVAFERMSFITDSVYGLKLEMREMRAKLQRFESCEINVLPPRSAKDCNTSDTAV